MARKILIVDDSRTIRLAVRKALTAVNDLEVIEAQDGEDAMTKLGENPGVKLVISDITMPWKDGMELLTEIKQSPEYQAIPVLILTAEGNPDEIRRAKTIGAHGWLIKPFKDEILVNAVRSLVAA